MLWVMMAVAGALAAGPQALSKPLSQAGPPAPPSAAEAFNTLLKLEGDWIGRTAKGRTFKVNFHLIANGTVLVERWVMSPTRESMTVYHLDGASLVATHYCPQGNQPRLAYVPEANSPRFSFAFHSATNLPDARAAHQQASWIELKPDGSFTRSETYAENGVAEAEITTYTRVAPVKATPPGVAQ